MPGPSLIVASGGHSSSRCAGLSLSWPLLLRSTGSRRAGSATVAHGPSCSAARGIFPDQGSNPCPLHWQADSQPLRHQGSPLTVHFMWIDLVSTPKMVSPLRVGPTGHTPAASPLARPGPRMYLYIDSSCSSPISSHPGLGPFSSTTSSGYRPRLSSLPPVPSPSHGMTSRLSKSLLYNI